MATAEEIAAFRLLIAEPDETTYTDLFLSGALDSASSPNAAASSIWTQKAAAAATLVNVSESGSSRSLGDLQRNALAMAKQFADAVEGDQSTSLGIRINRITRR
jgi:N-acetylmuramoyl-L-alanine amidase